MPSSATTNTIVIAGMSPAWAVEAINVRTDASAIDLTDAGRLLGHVELGLALLRDRAARIPQLEPGRFVELAHCVLCHHGADMAPGRRFGSPEALALYRLNALDASVKGALEHGLP